MEFGIFFAFSKSDRFLKLFDFVFFLLVCHFDGGEIFVSSSTKIEELLHGVSREDFSFVEMTKMALRLILNAIFIGICIFKNWNFYLLFNFAFSLIISAIFRFSILLSSHEIMSRYKKALFS